MLILFEADYPSPLVEALNSVMQLYSKKNIAVLTDSPEVTEDPTGETIVFLINWEKKGLSPAIRQRYLSGYNVFAFKYPLNDNEFDPFQFSATVLSLLPKLIKVIETSERPFLFTFRHNTNKLKKEVIEY
jgi:hypothetical protein